jgi:SOS-response transcriptional repressor LexA
MNETPQAALARLAAARGTSLSALSRMLGRNVAYLGQFVGRGTPKVLPERERDLLARFFGVDACVLGAPEREDAAVAVPYLAVAASAGPGAAVGGEAVVRHEPVARAALRALGVAVADASLIDVRGDSMAPTLHDGDRVLVDRADRAAGAGVHVLRIGDALSVKRLRRRGDTVEIVSDNPAYPVRVLPAAEVTLVGRARLLLRGL